MTPILGNLVPLTESPPLVAAFANPSIPAEMARCSYQALWRRVRDGKIQGHRIGALLFLDREQIEHVARSVLKLTGEPNARAPKASRPRAGRAVAQPSSEGAAA
jgi:hypothetical protein